MGMTTPSFYLDSSRKMTVTSGYIDVRLVWSVRCAACRYSGVDPLLRNQLSSGRSWGRMVPLFPGHSGCADRVLSHQRFDQLLRQSYRVDAAGVNEPCVSPGHQYGWARWSAIDKRCWCARALRMAQCAADITLESETE